MSRCSRVRRGDEGERAVLNRVVRLALRRGVLRFMLISVAPATDRNYALSSVASVRQQSSSLAGLGAVICVRMHASMHRDHDGHMATIDSIPLLHFPLSPPPVLPIPLSSTRIQRVHLADADCREWRPCPSLISLEAREISSQPHHFCNSSKN